MMTKNLRFRSAGLIPTELIVRRLRASPWRAIAFAHSLSLHQSSRFIQGFVESEALNHRKNRQSLGSASV